MKLSKLIEHLQSNLEEYGELDVVVLEERGERDLDTEDIFIIESESKLEL